MAVTDLLACCTRVLLVHFQLTHSLTHTHTHTHTSLRSATHRENGTALRVQLFDHDTLSSDDDIGEAFLPLSVFADSPPSLPLDTWLPVMLDGTQVGVVLGEETCVSDSEYYYFCVSRTHLPHVLCYYCYSTVSLINRSFSNRSPFTTHAPTSKLGHSLYTHTHTHTHIHTHTYTQLTLTCKSHSTAKCI
jgi:hypothetical protein